MKARTNNKVIISCAITGSIHTPTMSDALPITPVQISEQALAAAKAGAAIIHLHARDPNDGRPTRNPDVCLRSYAVSSSGAMQCSTSRQAAGSR